MMEKAMEAFMVYQSEAEEKFMKSEEERWKKETELEDRRRKEDKEHELRMMQMLGQMLQYQQPSYPSNSYDYEDY